MATISDIKSWSITDENITGNVGDTNITLVTTDFHEVEVLEVQAPAPIAIVDVGVVGLGNTGGGGTGAVDSVNGQTGVVVLDQDDILDGTTHKQYSATEKTKLAGIATGATANSTDAQLRDRSTHTGSQAISTVTGLQTALDGKASASHTHAESEITGLTTDLAGKQPLDSDLTAIAALAPTNDDIIQRKAGAWTNRTPSQVKTDLALTKSDVGLSNVDNTSDSAKPVSTAQQAALDGKANTSHTHAQADVTGLSTLLGLGFYFADGTTSTNARPSVPGKVIWVGGTTQPVNMATGDLWIKA